MGVRQDHKRHSGRITKTRRWQALRQEALRRDGWRCVQCPERRRLEVDHVLPVRTHPERAFDLDNLQCLCGPCHARKTRLEVGLGRRDPAREAEASAWRQLVRSTSTGQ
jgi:5-methylcytosine-specific restriction endonuclease McrA